MSRFTRTVFVSGSEFSRIKPGQWVALESGSRGQYLGTTSGGTVVIRWQAGKFGKPEHTRSNALLREYAVINGSV